MNTNLLKPDELCSRKQGVSIQSSPRNWEVEVESIIVSRTDSVSCLMISELFACPNSVGFHIGLLKTVKDMLSISNAAMVPI